MEIKRTLLPANKLKPLFSDPLKLQFGRNFTDYMFTMQWFKNKGWHSPEIKPYGPLLMDPACNVLHYSQEVFEGLKAYKSAAGEILMFRPRDNARRLNMSLRRMCMPELPEDYFMESLSELLRLEQRWIPTVVGTSLYIRPTAIGTEAALGVRPSDEYLYYVILSPVGPYFAEGFNPVGLYVSDDYVRAVSGGTGEAKTGGNYAGSLLASQLAKEKGYSQVLWLDAKERRYIEEVGAMNIFFVIDGKLVTPKLTGSILHGITRKSVIQIAPELGMPVDERSLTIDEVVEGIREKRVTECFGAGTAAVISPVSKINYHDKEYLISETTGPCALKLFDTITGIQSGRIPDKYGWVVTVK